MTVRRRRSDRSGRSKLHSPGRPDSARREELVRFWAAIATGRSSEDAARDAGVSPPVGSRWFRRSGGMDAGRPIGTARGRMDLADAPQQRRVRPCPLRGFPAAPRVIAAGGDLQQPAHHGNRIHGLVGSHELEDPDGTEPVSRANQAAAFARISRSWRSRRFSRFSRRSSSRSAPVNPSARRPASRSACATQFRIACAEGSNSRDSSSGVRPAPTSSIICARNSAA